MKACKNGLFILNVFIVGCFCFVLICIFLYLYCVLDVEVSD